MSVGPVFWKEVREQFLRGGRPGVSLLINAGLALVLAGFVPFLFARGLPSGAALALAAGIGFSIVAFTSLMQPIAIVIDTIAGERERHTLETLLASPASDGAILLGKALPILLSVVVTAVWYGVVSVASLSFLHGLPGLLTGLALLVLGPLAALVPASFTTGLGLFLSQRAPTVKQGQQWLGYALMPFFLLPGIASTLGVRLFRSSADAPPWALPAAIGFGILVFLLLNALFWVLSFARFRRDRLLLR